MLWGMISLYPAQPTSHPNANLAPPVQASVLRYRSLCAVVGAGLFLLGGCANPMLRQASVDCDPESYRLFPIVLQSHRITEPVVVQVPDGTQHCITETVRQADRSTAVTRCMPNFTMQTRWTERWINVDLNAKERGIWHDRCVQQLCVERLGNPSCEPPTPAVNPAPSPSATPNATPTASPTLPQTPAR